MPYVIREQQRRRSACASAQSDQRLCCSLLREYNISRFYSRIFKTLASFCDRAVGECSRKGRRLVHENVRCQLGESESVVVCMGKCFTDVIPRDVLYFLLYGYPNHMHMLFNR